MARAGYDPVEYIRLWERMAKIRKLPIPIWLSTHTIDEERISRLKENLPNAMKEYHKATSRYGVGSPL